MPHLTFSKFYYSQREPASPDQTRTLVFALGGIPDRQIITAITRQKLLESLCSSSTNGSEDESEKPSKWRPLQNLGETVIGKLVGRLMELSGDSLEKTTTNIRDNLNSENPDPKILEEINRYRRNFIATALTLAQARLGRNQPKNFLETYRPYFSITEILDQAAQRIKDIIKNVIRDHLNDLNENQHVDDHLVKTITNQIISELQKLAIDSSDQNVELVSQIRQLLKDSDLISNLEQVVREILSDLGRINPEEAQELEQTNHQAGLTNLDTIIGQLKIVLATQSPYSAEAKANKPSLLEKLFNQKLRLPIPRIPMPIPTSWKSIPGLAILLGVVSRFSKNELINDDLIRMTISGSLGAAIGFIDGWQLAKKQLKIAAEAQAANNPEQPLANKPEFYKMISATALFENIQNALKNSDSIQPESIQELLRQIHLIRILWNEYQHPILKNDLDGENLGAIQNLAREYGITLDPRESPLVFYRNLLLLVEVLGIELIQKIQQSTQSESNLSLNSKTFWHQIGLNSLQKVVNQKVKEINRALGWLSNRGFYLSESLKNAIIYGAVNILLSEITRSALSLISK